MRVRLSMGLHGPVYLEVEQCRCCHDLVSVATDPLDAHSHCKQCQEPREVPCEDCAVLWREDLIEDGLCPSCVLDNEAEAERMAAAEE